VTPHLGTRSWLQSPQPPPVRHPLPGRPELADLGHAHRGLRPAP